MTSNVFHISSGEQIADGRTPDPEVVRLFEHVLEQARAGEVVGVVGAIHFFDNSSKQLNEGHCSGGTLSVAETSILRRRLARLGVATQD